MSSKVYFLLLVWWSTVLIKPAILQAQSDTIAVSQVVTISYEEAKARMIKENLQLLAARYDINMSEAQAVQAKLWNNPYLIWNQAVYSVEKNDYFNFTRQALIQVEQVFSIAGKHTNSVKLSKLNVEMSKLALEDVMRSLLLELGNSYASLNALQEQDTLYGTVLNNVNQLITASEQQQRTGALAGNEVVRLRSELISIQTQALQNRNEMEQAMSNLRVLLNLPSTTFIQTTEAVKVVESLQPLQDLITLALESRPDYKLSNRSIDYESRNLKLQKSISVPDIKFAYQPFDRGSNYVRPYEGFNIEAPIPIFDRNQGRIQESKVKIKQAQSNNQFIESKVTNETTSAYYQLINTQRGIENYSTQFIQQLEELNVNANTNYNRRNISILEFIDQQRIYVQTKIQQIQLMNQYNQSVNQLNFSVGREIF